MLAVVAAVGVTMWVRAGGGEGGVVTAPGRAEGERAHAAPSRELGGDEPRRAEPAGRSAPTGPSAEPPREDAPGEGGLAPTVDLTALRSRLPSNRYWELGAPTTDPAVQAKRKEVARQQNLTWGRIQAGEASEGEIAAYFTEQKRVHEDYVELCRTVLAEQGDSLSERDRGLFELGQRMHQDGLTDLHAQEKQALERKKTQDRRREEWERSGKPLPENP